MKKSLYQKLIILLFALPALACALTGGDEPTATPTAQAPAATAEVSATLAATEVPPTPTLEVEVEPTIDLTAGFVTFTSPETGLTVQHPSDWAVQDFFVLLIATDETIFDAPGAIQEGAGVVFAAGPADEFESTDPIDLANEAVTQFELSDDATITEGPTAITIQGQPAAIARVEGTPAETGIPVVGLAVVVINGDRVGVGLGVTPAETADEYLPTIEAMFNTLVVGQPAEPPEVIGSDDLPTMEDSVMISVGDNFASTLDENGRRDFFFNGQADSTVTFTAEPMETDIDLVIEIFDTDLNSLVREDNEFSGEAEALVFTPTADGTYFIRVSDFYGSSGGFNMAAVEGAVQATINTETIPLESGILIEGALTGEPLQYVFSGAAGQPSTIFLLPGDDWDPTLTILGPDGSILVDEVDDGFSGEPEAITYIPDTDGDFIVMIDAFSIPKGSYSLYLIDAETAFTAEGTVPLSESQNYRVCVPANASLIVVVMPSGDFDPVVEINGPGGGQLLDPTDNGAGGDAETVFMTEGISPDAATPIIVSVKGFGGQDGEFTIFITSTSAEENVVLDGC